MTADDTPPADQVTLAEAARRLNTTPDAIRQRIKRGTLAAEKLNGKWYVRLDATEHVQTATGQTSEHDQTPTGQTDQARLAVELEHARALLAEVAQQRDDLRQRERVLSRQLDESQRGEAELRTLLAQAQANMGRLLPAPRETEDQGQAAAAQGQDERRPRWRFWRR